MHLTPPPIGGGGSRSGRVLPRVVVVDAKTSSPVVSSRRRLQPRARRSFERVERHRAREGLRRPRASEPTTREGQDERRVAVASGKEGTLSFLRRRRGGQRDGRGQDRVEPSGNARGGNARAGTDGFAAPRAVSIGGFDRDLLRRAAAREGSRRLGNAPGPSSSSSSSATATNTTTALGRSSAAAASRTSASASANVPAPPRRRRRGP